MTEPIDVAYVEIRPTPNAKQEFKADVEQIVNPAADNITRRVGKAVGDGLKHSNVQTGLAAGVGAAIGTQLGRGIGSALGAAARGLTLLPRTGFAELKDYQAGLAQLQAGIKSTGGVAGLTAGEMEDLASAVQKYSGQTDDSIVRSESFLLTFDKIRDSVGAGNDIFTRATKATADLAARLGGDAAGKAILLGKALNDPVAGLTALTGAGIQFDDSQKATIKRLVETGDVLGAQKIVLAEVEKQVGGSAKAYGETLPGEIDRGKRAFEDISQTIVGATFSFIDHNRKISLAVAGVVGGIYTAHKAVLAYRALQDTLFGGIAKKVEANAVLAKSYDGVALAAGRAAEAETLAAGGGAAGGAAAGAGAAGAARAGAKVGTLAGLGIRAGIVGAATYGAFKYGDQLLPTSLQSMQAPPKLGSIDDLARGSDGKLLKDSAGNYVLKSTLAKNDSAGPVTSIVDPRIAVAAHNLAQTRGVLNDPTQRNAALSGLAGALDSPFDTLASRTQGDPVAAREAQRKADLAVTAARRNLDKVRAGSGGATTAQITSAEARVAAAEAALQKRGGDGATERARLAAAEAHLSELRAKGGVNTDKLRAAEDRLKEARHAAGQAADDTKKAEATTALSVQDLVGRLGGQLKNARGLDADARKLVKDGISKGVLTELYSLEKQAPGTLDRVAKGLTPALAKQLNAQYGALQKAQQDFLLQPLRAAVEAAKAEQDKILKENAEHQAAVYRKALQDAGVELTPKGAPTPTGPGGRPEAPDTSAPADPTHGPLSPNQHGAPKVTTTVRHYHVHGDIVANNPAQLRADLEKLDRLDALR